MADELESVYDVLVTVDTGICDPSEIQRLGGRNRDHLVRIAREAIVNAVKHGDARQVEVVLERRESELVLRISDDGCGLAEPAAGRHAGFGLPEMSARASELGGQLVARRSSAGGTDIEVSVLAGQSP